MITQELKEGGRDKVWGSIFLEELKEKYINGGEEEISKAGGYNRKERLKEEVLSYGLTLLNN